LSGLEKPKIYYQFDLHDSSVDEVGQSYRVIVLCLDRIPMTNAILAIASCIAVKEKKNKKENRQSKMNSKRKRLSSKGGKTYQMSSENSQQMREQQHDVKIHVKSARIQHHAGHFSQSTHTHNSISKNYP
jgi:hypothetical protein